jgi:hypothetical protein
MSYMKIKKIDIQRKDDFVCLMVFNATFKNISAISWRSVLLVEETGWSWKKTPTCHKSMANFVT